MLVRGDAYLIPITNCPVQFKKRCPTTWERLEPTAEHNVRICETCWRRVFRCMTETEAWYHAMEGHCVAVLMPDSSRFLGEPRAGPI
jgi:hypothetical protein